MRAPSDFREIWLCDFEFWYPHGEGGRPQPICLVAKEYRSGRLLRLWEDDLRRLSTSPFPWDENALFVAYYASAELSCFHFLGWPVPKHVLDLYVEFRAVMNNGLRPPFGRSLLGALNTFGITGLDHIEKDEMRQLALRGGPWTLAERFQLLEYCESDVQALDKLLPAMSAKIDLPRALLRGRYMKAAARMEWTGVPVDVPTLEALRENWTRIQIELVDRINPYYGVYEGISFRTDRWDAWTRRQGIPWPRLPSGTIDLKAATFRDMSKLYPVVGPIHELRYTLAQMRLERLQVGLDGFNRTLVSAFGGKASRNTPSNTKSVFGPATWIRSLIAPKPGYGVAYIDWEQQEIGIAGALSGDGALCEAYISGDPYLSFAVQAGLAPTGATKESHAAVREQCKTTVLGIQYGMGSESLADRLEQSPSKGRLLLNLHREAYPVFWKWSDCAIDHAILHGRIQSVFGWPLYANEATQVRTLRNFPMQANGAEMLRLACCFATEQGIEVCWPIHDAVLIQAPLGQLDEQIERMQACMAKAGEIVLSGFTLRSDAKVVRYPERYRDPRGVVMWDTIQTILARQTLPYAMAQNDP